METTVPDFGGLKQREITPCAFCGKGVMHDRQMAATRARVTRMVANLNAIQRQHGLEMMIGGLAGVMGPDEDLLKAIEREWTVLVCDACAMRRTVADLWSVGEGEQAGALGDGAGRQEGAR